MQSEECGISVVASGRCCRLKVAGSETEGGKQRLALDGGVLGFPRIFLSSQLGCRMVEGVRVDESC